jgi:hypothetical protein
MRWIKNSNNFVWFDKSGILHHRFCISHEGSDLHAVKYNENIVHRDRFSFSVITEFNLVYSSKFMHVIHTWETTSWTLLLTCTSQLVSIQFLHEVWIANFGDCRRVMFSTPIFQCLRTRERLCKKQLIMLILMVVIYWRTNSMPGAAADDD